MATIYKTAEGKNKVLALYDQQIEKLSVPYNDIYVDTPYGKTHLVETGDDKWLIKCILPMAISEDNIDEDTFETVKSSIDNVKIKTGMPGDVNPADIKKCKAPTLVMAAEKDCLFPAELVIPQAEAMKPNCTTYLLRDRGHINYLTAGEQEMIIEFLRQEDASF